MVPFDPDWTKETVAIDPFRRPLRYNQGLFTQQVRRIR